MSGGHFDYACFEILQFADELQHEIDRNDDMTLDEFGYTRGRDYSPETMRRLVLSLGIIETAGKLAREVEWLYSGDHGEESFQRLVDKILVEQGMQTE